MIFRKIVLMLSPAPTRDNAKRESGKKGEIPKRIVPMPYRMIPAKRSGPGFFRWPICANASPATIAPTDGAEYKSPSPIGPTCKISFAKSGIRDVADAKKELTKSKSIVDQMIVCDLTNFKPSIIADKETRDVSPVTSPEFFIRKSAKASPPKENALKI